MRSNIIVDSQKNTVVSQKIVRRLIAAEGYRELGLPERSLRELAAITDPSTAGLLEPYVHYLRGEALMDLERYHEAIDPLHEAARTIPAPFNRVAWLSLGECFRQDGQPILAHVAELFADANDYEQDEQVLEEVAEAQGFAVNPESEEDWSAEWSPDTEDDANYDFDADASDWDEDRDGGDRPRF